MYIKAIYSDLTQWNDKARNWHLSPLCNQKFGLLVVCLWLDPENAIRLEGSDYYAIQQEEEQIRLAQWNGFHWTIPLSDVTKQSVQPYPLVDSFKQENIRSGLAVADPVFLTAQRVSYRWKVSEEDCY